MSFPRTRMRRLRMKEGIRDMVAETRLDVKDLIYPMFVVHGKEVKDEIPSMPGCFHFSLDRLVEEAGRIYKLGIPAVILFGIPKVKDEAGSEGYDKDGIVQRSIKALKDSLPELLVITDVCLCDYTSHGHCGIVADGEIKNDPTLDLLVKIAVSHARAGSDMVAPSDMMDGRVGAIREGLEREGFINTPIMSYAAKYASSLYNPFRDAVDSAPSFGDRRSHQMQVPNAREAMREIELDIEEGADIVMVKPAIAYLDIIFRVKERFDLPVAAYNVSGEYSMVKAAAKEGWIDGERVMMEMLTCIKRAGADMILTYFAPEAARLLADI
ncbi:MAG: porphobilinogen synthase [Deltaproteobacteria bacterium]|uniref:Delta-aminolevulinic acid dehydratase n=1 Tax=Candidatus Zymogenus saltonus TaxID=2844893 RepID=A0A9D8PN18_9DELT|nr:porphobilinogen synthase [Candidatus Zymogenus saltonus]